MKKEYRRLKKLIEKSQNILILTHKGPDFDAFASCLILKVFINKHYPKKNVVFKARQSPTQNIPHMHDIQIVRSVDLENEDLVVLIDAGGWDICVTPEDTIHLTKAKIAIIDHHDTPPMDADVVINFNMSSATEQVIHFCKWAKGNSFIITNELSLLGQIGIISDTGRFLYDTTRPETYELMGELRRIQELDIEEFLYKDSKFPLDSLLPLKIFIHNIHIQGDMSYTYITNSDIQNFKLTKVGINSAHQLVRDRIIRNIFGVHWGFIVKPSYQKEGEWYVSLRSTKGYQPVNIIAEALNGGGHQYSSACKIEAKDGDEAVKKVLEVISQVVTN